MSLLCDRDANYFYQIILWKTCSTLARSLWEFIILTTNSFWKLWSGMNLQALSLEFSYMECVLKIILISSFLPLWLKIYIYTHSILMIVTLFFSQLKQKYDWAELSPQIGCKSSISRISALSVPTLFPVNLKQTNK